jgi:hypothetical protein
MMATETPAKGKYVLRCAGRLGKEMKTKVRSRSGEPVVSMFLVSTYVDSER